jgi:hypothetical protein
MESCSVKLKLSIWQIKKWATQNLKLTATVAEANGVKEPTVRISDTIVNSTTDKQE